MLSNHPRLLEADVSRWFRDATQEDPIGDRTDLVLLGDAVDLTSVIDEPTLPHPDTINAVDDAGVGGAGDDVVGWSGSILLLRRKGALAAVQVQFAPIDVPPPIEPVPNFAAAAVGDPLPGYELVELEDFPQLTAPAGVNIHLKYYGYFSGAGSRYGIQSPVRASMVGVGGGLAIYTETLAQKVPAPEMATDYQPEKFTLTYYGPGELEPTTLTVGAKTRRISYSRT